MQRQGEAPGPSPSTRKTARQAPLVCYKVSVSWCSSGGSVLGPAPGYKRKKTQEEEKRRARKESGSSGRAGAGAPQAWEASGPWHIAVRMSMRLFRPDR